MPNDRLIYDSALIIFVRNPILGNVKSRLARTVGAKNALAIYVKLLYHTRLLSADIPADKFVFYDDFVDRNDLWDNDHFQKRLQSGHDLGERMLNAFEEVFKNNYQSAVIIGSDCLELSRRVVEHSFEKLKTTDCVIGPAKDGGYYLLGLHELIPEVFSSIPWSSNKVFQKTAEILFSKGKSLGLLETLNDIDDIEDIDEEWLSRASREFPTDQ